MSTNPVELASITFDISKFGGTILVIVIGLAIAAMTVNAIVTARRVKKADKELHDRVEGTLHSKDKKAAEPSKTAPKSSKEGDGEADG